MKKMKVIINEKNFLFTLIGVLYNIKNVRQNVVRTTKELRGEIFSRNSPKSSKIVH